MYWTAWCRSIWAGSRSSIAMAMLSDFLRRTYSFRHKCAVSLRSSKLLKAHVLSQVKDMTFIYKFCRIFFSFTVFQHGLRHLKSELSQREEDILSKSNRQPFDHLSYHVSPFLPLVPSRNIGTRHTFVPALLLPKYWVSWHPLLKNTHASHASKSYPVKNLPFSWVINLGY